jgi:vitamin K-dependent gamma-carboxylase
MHLERRVDAASLVLMRVIVGLLLFVSAVRFLARGWVQELLLAPSVHFHYWGASWISEPSPWLAHALFVSLAAAGVLLASGRAARLAAGLALLCFGWIELCDLTYYLNHYYFLTCLLATFCLVAPRAEADGQIPVWKLYLVRVQVGLVYVYAGIAKLGRDWLLHAEPLSTWLSRHADLPIVGPWLDEPWLAFAASWSGALFDLCIVPALWWARTRAWAYLGVVVFHLATGLLFPIGMFPWFMIGCATIWLSPTWPRRWLAPGARLDFASPEARVDARVEHVCGCVAALLLALQLALPWRFLLYPGSVLWHEQGYRYAYRVMLIEKAGMVEYRVRDRASGREWQVDPADELTRLQARMLSTQPDLILQYAHHLAQQYEPGTVEVRVDAFVSLHARPYQRLIDPEVDLAREVDGLAAKTWILPGPTEPPP